MIRNAQFDLHPDAERLNAFAEQALVGWERERMLEHLAVCSRCREVVFLTQEASMEVPALVAAAAASTPQVNRVRPRFRNLRLVWVPVAALAAGITTVYVVHVRQVVPATEVARVEKDSGSVRATPQAPPAPDAAAKGVGAAERPAQPKAKSFQPVEMVEVAPPPPGINAPVLTRDNALLAMQKKTDELKTASEGAVVQSQKETAQVADEMQAPTAKRAAPASADRAESQQVVVTSAAAPMMQAGVSPGPKLNGASTKIGGSLAVYTAKPTGLPSGQAAASTAVAQHYVLAVDKAGSLFLSTDAGVHWSSIGRQWIGRAVAVRAQADPNASSGATQNTFELVNDLGKVWVSSDGRSWKAK